MRRRLALPGLAIAMALGALALPSPEGALAAKTTLRPAAGPPGTTAVLSGHGFPAGRLRIAIGPRMVRVHVARAGTFRARLEIPAGAPRALSIVVGRRPPRVRTVFQVLGAAPDGVVTEVALSGGARLRYAPAEQVAGGPVVLRGSGLGRRARLTVGFARAPSIRLRAGQDGRVHASREVPEVAPGSQAIRTRLAGRIVLLPFTVRPDPTIAGAGDIACGADSGRAACRQMDTSDLLLALRPDAVLALGDTQYEKGQYDNFLRFYEPSWGRLKAITRPVVGNHEYDNGGCDDACGYFDYFNGPGQSDGPAGRRGEGFYAFNVGAWRLYALNSNCGRGAFGCQVGEPQERWLRSDLAAHPRRCTLAFMHHPLFTSDTRDFDAAPFADRLRPLWQAFYDAGGDVMLAGHSHFYERFAPQNPSGQADAERGIRQFIVGTGGRNVYGFGAIEPSSEVRGASTFGVLQMTLHARSYDWRFVPVGDQTFADRGTDRCH